jgi:hypothetical protein
LREVLTWRWFISLQLFFEELYPYK